MNAVGKVMSNIKWKENIDNFVMLKTPLAPLAVD